MPRKCCIKNYAGLYMHPSGTEETFEDINGNKHPRYRNYDCDCGAIHQLDILRNVWIM